MGPGPRSRHIRALHSFVHFSGPRCVPYEVLGHGGVHSSVPACREHGAGLDRRVKARTAQRAEETCTLLWGQAGGAPRLPGFGNVVRGKDRVEEVAPEPGSTQDEWWWGQRGRRVPLTEDEHPASHRALSGAQALVQAGFTRCPVGWRCHARLPRFKYEDAKAQKGWSAT